jgi:hypothetical protein
MNRNDEFDVWVARAGRSLRASSVPQFSLSVLRSTWCLVFSLAGVTMMNLYMMNLRRLRLPVAQIVTASLIAIALPIAPAKALFGGARNPYESCAAGLTRAQVSAAEAASACGQALKPDDLGTCVNRIADEKVSGADALLVCRQVRRPVEAASCVVGIRRGVSDTAIVDVLDSCRRSLLPQTFSDCVVGLNSQLKVGGKQAIASCLDASDRPRDLLPTFIPLGNEIPIPITPSLIPTPVVPSTSQPSTQTQPSTPSTTQPSGYQRAVPAQ